MALSLLKTKLFIPPVRSSLVQRPRLIERLNEIARQLYVSKNTVRSHIGHIYDKLDVHSREDAVQRAQELGLL